MNVGGVALEVPRVGHLEVAYSKHFHHRGARGSSRLRRQTGCILDDSVRERWCLLRKARKTYDTYSGRRRGDVGIGVVDMERGSFEVQDALTTVSR